MTPVLDELLYVDEAGCAARLAQIRSEDPQLAEDIGHFLAQRTGIARDDFLGGYALDLVVDATGGEDVGNYTLERELGQGGMGTVWLARRNDGRYEGQVAIKFLDAPRFERGGIERFRREGSVLARLAHPNIARLIDAGVTERGQPYLVLEYVDGEQIDQWCSARGLGTHERVRLFREVLAAVAHAHSKLILHRDLKPSNILVTSDGHVKLLDFGIAKLLDESSTQATALTQLAGRALTPDYASPEQILRQPLSVASDVYSLGVVLYELLCGHRPYKLKHDSLGSLEDAIVTAEPASPSAAASVPSLRRGLVGDIDTIVLKALKKAPADRYATANELLDDLDRHLDGLPVRARADSPWYRARKFVARNRVVVGAAAGITLALIVGAGVAAWQAGVARSEATRAREINRFVLSLFDSANPFDGARSDVRAVDLLKQARARIERDLKGRPDLQVELLATIGKSLSGLASYQDARETLQRALEIAAANASIASSPAAEDATIQLVDVLVLRGDNAVAEELLNRSETALHARRPSLYLARLLDGRGHLFVNTGRAKEAVPVAQRALGIARSLPDVPRVELARIADGLARAEYHADDNEGALRDAQDALALFESSGSEGKNEAIRERALIARIQRDLGRLDEAAATLGTELPRLREAFGEHSREYTVNLAEYATLQDLRGDLAAAAASIQQALVAADFGTSERELYVFEKLAGEIALQQRDLAVAREHLNRSLGHAARWQGKNATLVSEMLLEMFVWQTHVVDGDLAPMPAALNSLREDPITGLATTKSPGLIGGVVCTSGYEALAQGEPAKAIHFFESAGTTFEAIANKNFWFIAPWCLTGQGRALMLTGALDQAEVALDQALQLHRRRRLHANPMHAEALIAVAQLYLRRGRSEDALRAAREADEFWKGYRQDDRLAGEAAVWLGRALIAHGDDAAGQVELRRGNATLARTRAPADRQTVRSDFVRN